MKKLILSRVYISRLFFSRGLLSLIIIFSAANGFSQVNDSLKEGRICKIVLYNGFEAEGFVSMRSPDTVYLKTDITELKIPVIAIKFVLNPGIEISDLEDRLISSEEIETPVVKTDTSAECDVYTEGGNIIKNVQIVSGTDTSVFAFKDGRVKDIPYTGIRKIVFKQSAPFGYGYLYGSAVGFAIGFFPFALSKGGGHPDFSGVGFGFLFGIVCSVPAGLIGGIIGVLSASDKVYLFNKGTDAAKINKIKYLIKKHPG